MRNRTYSLLFTGRVYNTKAKKLRLPYYLPLPKGRTDRFISFPIALEQSEMPSDLSRI